MANRLEYWREKRGLTQPQMAHEAGISQGYYSKMERGLADIGGKHLEAFAKVLNTSIASILGEQLETEQTVPLVGYVGAQDLYSWEPEIGPWGEIEQVEAPPLAGNYVAVRVRGNSMAPVYRNGHTLYSRGPGASDIESCIGEDCIVQMRNGGAYLKILRKGSKEGLYTLESYNPEVSPMVDVEIEWAATVDWHDKRRRK